MNCKKIREYLPLYAGTDLTPEKAEATRAHLATCDECQKEVDKYLRSLQIARNWLSDSQVEWEEGEWRRTVQKVTSEKTKILAGFAPWPFKKGWAFALMGALVVMLVFFVARPLFLGIEDFRVQTTLTKLYPQHQEDTAVKSPQDVVSMTMVSKETGLKVVWILNKNFNLEENE